MTATDIAVFAVCHVAGMGLFAVEVLGRSGSRSDFSRAVNLLSSWMLAASGAFMVGYIAAGAP